MSNPWIVLIAVLAVALLYVLMPLMADTYRRLRKSRALRCPETGGQVRVDIDASRAAVTSAFGRPLLRVRRCSLWPAKEQCNQGCLTLPEVEAPETMPLQTR